MLVEENPLAIIADDLTGACDTACQFCQYGMRVVATDTSHLVWDRSIRVLAVNSDSRKQSSTTAHRQIREISTQLLKSGRIPFYKKIDSTLKGNWPIELDALVGAWLPQVVLIAPAYPCWGRTTEKGIQCLDGRPLSQVKIHHSGKPTGSETGGSADVMQILRQQFGRGVELIKRSQLKRGPQWIEKLIERYRFKGSRFIVFDAVSDDDLKCICLGGSRVNLRVLWVGSGGLARFLPLGWGYCVLEQARQAASQPAANATRKPILLVNGSLNPTNAEQLKRVCEKGLLSVIEIEQQDSELSLMTQTKRARALQSLEQGDNLAISSPCSSSISRSRLQDFHDTLHWLTFSLMDSNQVGGLIIIGGDTAAKVYRRAGSLGVEILGEVEPGIPYGKWIGGLFAGCPVVTKAGGFGQVDTLVRALEILKCQ